MLASRFFASLSAGQWLDERGSNLLDGGAPFYDTYETAEGGHMAVACLEPQFFAEFARLLPLEARFAAAQHDRSAWEEMRAAIAARMMQKTREEWTALFEGTDACVAPVLSLSEAAGHAHARARHSHVSIGSLSRPAPAPRFSRTPMRLSQLPDRAATLTLQRFGLEEGDIRSLIDRRVVE
jgi:alpha-methylacyl-CoA racemase